MANGQYTAYTLEERLARFWSRVDQSGGVDACWIWTGSYFGSGYGQVSWGNHTNRRAHRVAWEVTHGVIPDNMRVLHKCDNRRCCNPQHLFLGTDADNMADKVSKGRQARGEGNGRCKLTDAQVAEIRELYKSGDANTSTLSRMYGVGSCHISRLIRRKNRA